jgi:hypothetical protein
MNNFRLAIVRACAASGECKQKNREKEVTRHAPTGLGQWNNSGKGNISAYKWRSRDIARVAEIKNYETRATLTLLGQGARLPSWVCIMTGDEQRHFHELAIAISVIAPISSLIIPQRDRNLSVKALLVVMLIIGAVIYYLAS